MDLWRIPWNRVSGNLNFHLDICFYIFNLFIFKVSHYWLSCLNNATKIGEASFSEVFTAYAPNFTTTRVKCVFKIIPFGRGKEVWVVTGDAFRASPGGH